MLIALAIVVLLAGGFAFYKFAGGGARDSSRESRSAISENASPAGEELMRTPELGLEAAGLNLFFQRDERYAVVLLYHNDIFCRGITNGL